MSASSNKFGQLFCWTSFGESHGPAMGVVIDGCPAGVQFDEALLLEKLARRRPGQSMTSQRQETDQPEILSGLFENKTLGTPIAVLIRNSDARSEDYQAIKEKPRVGHADDLWQNKFGLSDHRGGGRASARETVNWVVAGSFAEMFLTQSGYKTAISVTMDEMAGEKVISMNESSFVEKLHWAKDQGESFGATLKVKISSPPQWIGEPVFKKIKSQMAHAFMTINACVAVELGGGFSLAKSKGTDLHQQMDNPSYGGARGGISTGEDLIFRLAFKPTSSIKDVAKKGRHDPCVAIRAIAVAEAMAWSVLADLVLAQKLNRL